MYENSVNDRPFFSRISTKSLASMYGTVKCLPVSRRNSMSDSSPSQSRLLTITAWAAPGEKSRNRSSCAWIAATFRSRVASSSRFRSDDRPEGSPIMPVPPPTSA